MICPSDASQFVLDMIFPILHVAHIDENLITRSSDTKII